MASKLSVVLLLGLTGIYLWALGWIAIGLLRAGGAVGIGLGVALGVLALLSAAVVVREVVFGLATQRLGRQMHARGLLLPDSLLRGPGGRIDRGAADARFETVKGQVEAAPEDWTGWFNLGIAYREAGDGRRGRAAVRRAIALERATRTT